MNCDEVIRCLTEHICIEDIYEKTTEMENECQLQISSEFKKEIPVVVSKNIKENLIFEHFEILKYKQTSLNWKAFLCR